MSIKSQEEKKEERIENIIAVLIVAVIILVIVALFQGWFTSGATEEDEQIYSVSIDDDPLLGDIDAPVTIIEFSDFSCTYCAVFVQETKPLLEEYAANGTVRFIFRDYPLTSIHPKALQIARASECAHEQGTEFFWDFHDLVYANLDKQELGHIRGYAQEIGLNMTEYDSCFANEYTTQEIQRDIQDGRVAGVTGTPTFFINGKKTVGFITQEALAQKITEALEQ